MPLCIIVTTIFALDSFFFVCLSAPCLAIGMASSAPPHCKAEQSSAFLKSSVFALLLAAKQYGPQSGALKSLGQRVWGFFALPTSASRRHGKAQTWTRVQNPQPCCLKKKTVQSGIYSKLKEKSYLSKGPPFLFFFKIIDDDK